MTATELTVPNAETPAPTTPTYVIGEADPTFPMRPSVLSRFLRIATAKGAGGTPPFAAVDIVHARTEGGAVVSSFHRDRGSKFAVRVEQFINGPTGADFECAVAQGQWLLDYLDSGIFADEYALAVRYSNDAVPKVHLTNGVRSVSTPAQTAEGTVLRPSQKDGYGLSPDAFWVSSDPAKRPEPSAAWPVWAERGYSVATVPLSEVETVLAAGSALVAHQYEPQVEVVFNGDGTVRVSVIDPKRADGDSVDLAAVPGARVLADVADRYSLLFGNVEPFLRSILSVKTDRLYLVHHRGETRMNVAAVERDATGALSLRVTQTFATQKDAALAKK